jgi:hypothetical protein
MSVPNFDVIDTLTLVDYAHELSLDILAIEEEIIDAMDEGYDAIADELKDELFMSVQILNAAETELKDRGRF